MDVSNMIGFYHLMTSAIGAVIMLGLWLMFVEVIKGS